MQFAHVNDTRQQCSSYRMIYTWECDTMLDGTTEAFQYVYCKYGNRKITFKQRNVTLCLRNFFEILRLRRKNIVVNRLLVEEKDFR